jgi:hypothetical protein
LTNLVAGCSCCSFSPGVPQLEAFGSLEMRDDCLHKTAYPSNKSVDLVCGRLIRVRIGLCWPAGSAHYLIGGHLVRQLKGQPGSPPSGTDTILAVLSCPPFFFFFFFFFFGSEPVLQSVNASVTSIEAWRSSRLGSMRLERVFLELTIDSTKDLR